MGTTGHFINSNSMPTINNFIGPLYITATNNLYEITKIVCAL